MHNLNQQKAALTLGLFLSGLHAIWSILIAIGLAQPLVDFVMWAHMIHTTTSVGPFDATAAVSLIVLTFVVGYVIGWGFSSLWNKLHRRG